MANRREFIAKSTIASAALATTPFSLMAKNVESNSFSLAEKPKLIPNAGELFPSKFGLGGVGLGNGWHPNSNEQITEMMNAAWDAGIRYFDTSPFYGFGLSERRFGHFLSQKPREEFVISTKIGRVFEANRNFEANYDSSKSLWKSPSPFSYKFDYTAAGVRKSIEDSLQRMGLTHFDMVLVHDLSSDTPDLGDKWVEQFEIAKKGAFPELTKMRDEGIIKGWGMGVNTPQPIMNCLEVADPNIMLVAIQYTLFDHKNAVNQVMPALEKRKVQAIIGGPLNAGFAANRDRWNYGNSIPEEMVDKRKKINKVIKKYDVELATVALNFSALHPATGAVIPGASLAEQVEANVKSFNTKIPSELWEELKSKKLIEANVPV